MEVMLDKKQILPVFFFFFFNILLRYSWLTVFQVHSKVIVIYTHLLFLKWFSIIGY